MGKGVKYELTIEALDNENAAKALRFIANNLLDEKDDEFHYAHGDGGGIGGEPWSWNLRKSLKDD